MKSCMTSNCSNVSEGSTDFCAQCNRRHRKIASERKKEAEKKQMLLSKSKPWYPAPKKVGTTNTWGCSSGKRVTQLEINRYRDAAYNEKSKSTNLSLCEGCGGQANCWAHIIPQATCKNTGKTELIWHLGNFFRSCYDCNSAIENPKGGAWLKLHNKDYCLRFIQLNDSELFAKFESRLETLTPKHL